jgi:hypothetical protein
MEARDRLRELALAMSGDGILQIKNRHSSLKYERKAYIIPYRGASVVRPSANTQKRNAVR